MYQYISKMPTSQVKVDLGELKTYINSMEKAFNSKNPQDPRDYIDANTE